MTLFTEHDSPGQHNADEEMKERLYPFPVSYKMVERESSDSDIRSRAIPWRRVDSTISYMIKHKTPGGDNH